MTEVSIANISMTTTSIERCSIALRLQFLFSDAIAKYQSDWNVYDTSASTLTYLISQLTMLSDSLIFCSDATEYHILFAAFSWGRRVMITIMMLTVMITDTNFCTATECLYYIISTTVQLTECLYQNHVISTTD